MEATFIAAPITENILGGKMSLCFLRAMAAYKRGEGNISEQEYHNHLLAHFQGARHPEDETPSNGAPLGKFEPWAGPLRELALYSEYEVVEGTYNRSPCNSARLTPLTDISSYKQLFAACTNGDLETFKRTFEALKCGAPNPLQPAACLAAQKKHPDILRYCLAQGVQFDNYLNRAGQMGADSAEMLELLLAADWAGVRDSAKAAAEQIVFFGKDSFQGKWLSEHAASGRIDQKTIEDARMIELGAGDKMIKVSRESFNEWFGDIPW